MTSAHRLKLLLPLLALLALPPLVAAQQPTTPSASPVSLQLTFDDAETPQEVSKKIQILIMLTALSLAPSALIMCTSFTRILIVFSMLRRAIGTQQTPPAQILAGLSLFLTVFTMMPVWNQVNETALQPYTAGEITQKQAMQRGTLPIKEFMLNQTGEDELQLFMELSGTDVPEAVMVPLHVLASAFMISELKTAFQMGFLIFLPFLVIDLVIASSLMSMGMMMLPPMMISLPIKLLFFVLADGWTLVVRGIVSSFA
jgi:flagellar biosynthesis protein FliP